MKQIPGHKSYYIDEKGQLWSGKKTGPQIKGENPLKLVSGWVTTQGYRRVIVDGKMHHLHRLVLQTYTPIKKDKGLHAAHDDRNRLNNAPSNLSWKTPKQNEEDKVRHGTKMIGERVNGAKISSTLARMVKRLLAINIKAPRIAKLLNVGIYSVYDIKRNKTWKHVTLN